MTNQSQSNATIAAIAAASLSDKQTHDFIAVICPAVSYRVDTECQTHIITTEGDAGLCGFSIYRGNTLAERIEVRREVILAALAMQSEIDAAIEDSKANAKATAYDAQDAVYIKQGKIADYIAYATLFVMGVAAGLVLACITASAVLSNLPQ